MPPESLLNLCPSCGYPVHAGHGPKCLASAGKNETEQQTELSKTAKALALIESMGGHIDTQVKPYKQFDLAKHERFLIQRGNIGDQEVVFKAGEAKDQETIKNESRNLRVIEHATVKAGAQLDVHFVRQVGEIYGNEEMVGFATEYLQDDPELKRNLTGAQKVDVIGRVIDNLQRLAVTAAARESGLPTHDGGKIVRDASHFLGELGKEGRVDIATAVALQELFQQSASSLAAEESTFVHGDAHGDNIFVKKNDDGNLDVSLLDFEGLRISNRYHDWSEILNKSAFLKHVQQHRPELYDPIKKNVENMWLDASVEFDEEAIIDRVTGGDPEKVRNFRLTRTYDMLTRIMNDRNNPRPMAQERVSLYLEQLKKAAQ